MNKIEIKNTCFTIRLICRHINSLRAKQFPGVVSIGKTDDFLKSLSINNHCLSIPCTHATLWSYRQIVSGTMFHMVPPLHYKRVVLVQQTNQTSPPRQISEHKYSDPIKADQCGPDRPPGEELCCFSLISPNYSVHVIMHISLQCLL